MTTTTESTTSESTSTPPSSKQKSFLDLGVDAILNEALAAKNITHPFPIQELTLPLALKGADIIGQARTGTGKTLAFGLPLLQRIDPNKNKTQALVIVPTRELCLQVADDLEIGKATGVSSIAVYGGVGYDEQIEALTSGVNVVVGTPGRTLDHLNRGNLDLSNVSVCVLDEADEMLDMGFLPDVERLLSGCPEERQTLLFSATMPTAIVKLARRFMDKPTFMRADAELHETAPTVDQYFFLVHRMDKPRVLARLLQSDERGGAFVFTRTKNMADRLVRELDDLKVRAIAVHGDLRQATREKNMDRFRDGKADVLVATEVAARGLDVDNVTHVVNYDCPDDEKMYLHRIGRTARAGAKGVAVTFAEFNEVDRVNVIRKRVGTEAELTEIFSTSDELTALFDLPEQTPWDHMGSTSSSGRSSSGRSSSGRSSGGRSSSSSSRDKGQKSDNRSRSGGEAKSDGKSHNSSRDTSRRSREPKDTRSDDSGRSGSKRPDRSSASKSDSSRTRTRTRTRGTTATAAVVNEATEEIGKDATNKSSDSSQRNRARPSDRRSSQNRSKGGSGSSSSKQSRGNSGRGGSNQGGSSSKGSEGRSSSSGKNSSGSSRSSSSGSNRARSNDRGSGGSQRDGGSGGGQDHGSTTRGQDARGDGTPRFSRRVEVQHLP